MIGGLASGAASLLRGIEAAKGAADMATANEIRARYYAMNPELIDGMRQVLENQRIQHMPYLQARQFTDEALRVMDMVPEHREEVRAHAIECLETWPDRQVAQQFIEKLKAA